MKVILISIILAFTLITNANATTLLDFNSGSGTTFPGWTWYPNGANDYGAAGYRKDDGYWQSGASNWMPRIMEKNDYGQSCLGVIDTTVLAPNTETGGSFKIYDDGTGSVRQASYWWQWDDNFGVYLFADANTDRMSFYFYPDGMTADSGLTTDPANANIHVGTYLCWDGGGLGGANCPTEASNQHYYHYLTVNDGTWLHVEIDRHPTHQRGMSGVDEPDDNPTYPRNYFQYMNSFYLEIRYDQGGLTNYWIDEINFHTTTQEENDISIASVWVGYWPGTDKWEIGFADNSFNATGYNATSQSTFEVRYSTLPITNVNYNSATIVEPEYWERGTTNQFRRGNSWKKIAWTRFELPDNIEAANDTIYFAIKDVSNTANGDGHNSQSPLVHTIDYALRATSETPVGGGVGRVVYSPSLRTRHSATQFNGYAD